MGKNPKERWALVKSGRRWGCLIGGLVAVLCLAVVLVILALIVAPQSPFDERTLIGDDVDSLALFDLSKSSRRVAQFIEVLIRPLSYEIQTHPENLKEEIDRLLSVVTYRRAIGLGRFDPEQGQEHWAVVLGLKRMGDPIKLVVKEFFSRGETRMVETATSSGVLLFWSEKGGPRYAIYRRAFVVASDAEWLDVVVERLKSPLKKSARASRLELGLPDAGKHRIIRAHALVTPERRRRWRALLQQESMDARTLSAILRIVEGSDLADEDLKSATLAGTLQPNGQLRFDLSVACRETPASLASLQRLGSTWNRLGAQLNLPSISGISRPTTSTTGFSFSWMTTPVEEILGLSPSTREPDSR